MKLKNNYTLTKLAGEYMAVSLDHPELFHGLIKLNESGAEIFRLLSEGKSESEIARELMEKYEDLDAATAEKAVSMVIGKLNEAGLLEA